VGGHGGWRGGPIKEPGAFPKNEEGPRKISTPSLFAERQLWATWELTRRAGMPDAKHEEHDAKQG